MTDIEDEFVRELFSEQHGCAGRAGCPELFGFMPAFAAGNDLHQNFRKEELYEKTVRTVRVFQAYVRSAGGAAFAVLLHGGDFSRRVRLRR